MHTCFQLGCCFCATSCLVKVCATDSGPAQECAGEGGRAARACCRIAHIIWKGIIWTRVIGMGCMTTQMIAEAKVPYDKASQGPKQKPQYQIHDDKHKMAPPKAETMNDRGMDNAHPNGTSRAVGGGDHNSDESNIEVTELTDILMPWEKSDPDSTNNQSPQPRPN
jgi:hypothetical protein